MFGIIAAVLFVGAAAFALATIFFMFRAYHDKMVAALMFQPMPQTPAVYHVHAKQRRNRPLPRARVQAIAKTALAA